MHVLFFVLAIIIMGSRIGVTTSYAPAILMTDHRKFMRDSGKNATSPEVGEDTLSCLICFSLTDHNPRKRKRPLEDEETPSRKLLFETLTKRLREIHEKCVPDVLLSVVPRDLVREIEHNISRSGPHVCSNNACITISNEEQWKHAYDAARKIAETSTDRSVIVAAKLDMVNLACEWERINKKK